ncbi:MAG: membrane protein insertase YidC [Bacteroidetes bacterium]|nr:membrane protein insertase YidC [Bacteroidota bacterium]
MDRNQVIGFTLIGILFLGFMYFGQPSAEEVKRQQAVRDSIAAYNDQKIADSIAKLPAKQLTSDSTTIGAPDSNAPAQVVEQLITLENDLLQVKLSNVGGKVAFIKLNDYRRSDSSDLVLTNPENTYFGFNYGDGKDAKNTNDLVFEIASQSKSSVSFVANTNGGTVEHKYTLDADRYILNFTSKWNGVTAKILHWQNEILQQEKSLQTERQQTTLYYKEDERSADYLSEMSENDEEELSERKIEWVSFKQQFFNWAVIPETPFTKGKVVINQPEGEDYLKQATATMGLSEGSEHKFMMYMGPNHYQTLNRLDIGLEKVIPLGWGIFGWVNKGLVIPVFNFLSGMISSYGIIILILTIFIKVILLFFTYKAFMSGAKMRALKPELDEIKKKNEGDAQAAQMEQMQLYRQTGVSPFGGCLPMILQFPILIAMFRFFPSSIELRQQKFLWADDLSSYDSIWDFGYVPIIDSIYGDHVSLFALLMTITTFVYTLINQQYQPQQQKELKYLPYIMPIIFLSFLNRYSAALSYYYFLANLISIGQTYLFKAFVDEKKLRAQIEENKNNPKKAASGGGLGSNLGKGMQDRMQKMLEQQQNKQRAIEQQRAQKNKGKK